MNQEPNSTNEASLVSAGEKTPATLPGPSPLVELIRASSADRTILVRVFQVEHGSCNSTGVEYRGRGIDLPVLAPVLYKSLLLPTQLNKCESASQLFAGLGAFFQQHVMLSEKQYMLLNYWTLASWFADLLPFFPCLAITGPAFSADLLLRVLRCVCRRPVLLAGMSPAILRALPVNELMPTLLIREPQLSKRMAMLLEASTRPGYLVASGKDVRQFYCAKCIYLGENVQQPMLRPSSVHIRVAGNGLTPARSLPSSDVIQDLQNQLLYFRFLVHDDVASSKFSVHGFLPEFGAIAQALGAPLVRDPELQSGIIELLKEQDQQARIDRGSGLNAVVLRAVLFHCHEGEQRQVLVREIASVVNRIYGEEGESLKISNETAGHVLKSLGLYTRRLGNMGRGLLLDTATQVRAHELAFANQVLPETAEASLCGYCHKLQLAQIEEVV